MAQTKSKNLNPIGSTQIQVIIDTSSLLETAKNRGLTDAHIEGTMASCLVTAVVKGIVRLGSNSEFELEAGSLEHKGSPYIIPDTRDGLSEFPLSAFFGSRNRYGKHPVLT